jgi:nicotinamidase-related amidase
MLWTILPTAHAIALTLAMAVCCSSQTLNIWPGIAPGSEAWTQKERVEKNTPIGTVIFNVRGVTQVVLTGGAMSIGVESTARSAYDLGYNVVLAVDAMTDRDTASHRHSIEKIFSCLGETAETDEVLKRLKQGL